MKNIFVFFTLFCLALQANAQTSENTIVNDDASWAALSFGMYHAATQYVYFDKDSTLASFAYKKVFSCNDSLHENIKYEGLIREQEKKTYFIPANSEREYLLYDFSMEEGMTFEYIDPWRQEPEPILFYAKQVDFIEINTSVP